MLYLIGLGLRDGDIAQNGIDALSQVNTAYAEFYTNAIEYDLDALEQKTGTDITVLDRDQVEDEDNVITAAREHDVAFLVSGDPLTATTHQDILFRARNEGIRTEVIHAPSILIAVAETGLSIYKFGRVTTLPEPYNGTVPGSPFDVMQKNQDAGLHTLMLLDIGMTADEALDILEEQVSADQEILVASELGTASQTIRAGTLAELSSATDQFGVPCSVIIPGERSENEESRLESFRA